jgi:hypothetical protein
MRHIPPSKPILVSLITIPKPAVEVKLPKPATPERPHSTFAKKEVRASGSHSRRIRVPKPVKRTIPLPQPKQPKLAMAPRHLNTTPRKAVVIHPKPVAQTKVISQKVADSRAPLPIPDKSVPEKPAPTTSTSSEAVKPGPVSPPALTGPTTHGGGTESGSPKGADEGSGTGTKGNGNGVGPGTGPGTGSGAGPFGIDAGPGEGPRHIVYVVDTSGSMVSRIDTTRQELNDALETLTSDESFNVIAFSTSPRLFDPDRMEPATASNISQAERWLDYQRPDGGTDLQDSLMQALEMPDVNVVVVITDGVPTVGETNFGKIARNIRRHNRNHAKIYTVGLIGKNPDGTDDSFDAARLLRELAADSGGTSKLVPLGVATPE